MFLLPRGMLSTLCNKNRASVHLVSLSPIPAALCLFAFLPFEATFGKKRDIYEENLFWLFLKTICAMTVGSSVKFPFYPLCVSLPDYADLNLTLYVEKTQEPQHVGRVITIFEAKKF
ncbi:hypothetical protein CRENBAI_009160 [Crenichthys baileyi]|uniref:Uncharacterized protein n=1 Tax=Crenichthys baileyi TaxID=28760 RepID=A0AAV9SMS5_9TELE